MQAHRIQRFPEVSAYFAALIIAGEDDVPAKPDTRAFKGCLEKLQIRPSEAVYVGDDWRNDICGAQDAGLHPVWLKHHAVQRNYPEVACDVPVISSLHELPPLLVSDRFSSQTG
jgi:putative hydrolase of the HAD superfamily